MSPHPTGSEKTESCQHTMRLSLPSKPEQLPRGVQTLLLGRHSDPAGATPTQHSDTDASSTQLAISALLDPVDLHKRRPATGAVSASRMSDVREGLH